MSTPTDQPHRERQTQCPACGGENWTHAFTDRNRREGWPFECSYVRCHQCGTLFITDVPAGLDAYYSDDVVDCALSGDTPALRRQLFPRAMRRLSKLLTDRPHSWPDENGGGRRILDFGCLDGAKLTEFHARGWQVAGVDLNARAIEAARARFPDGTFHAGPLETLPKSEVFDVIRTDNVVEHLRRPMDALGQMRMRLRPGGRLYVYVPSADSLSVRLLGTGSQSVWVPFHLQLFSRVGLKAVLSRAGFSDITIHSTTPLSWWPLSFRQAIGDVGWAKRPPTLGERAAARLAATMTPLWLAAAKVGLGEELVAVAKASGAAHAD